MSYQSRGPKPSKRHKDAWAEASFDAVLPSIKAAVKAPFKAVFPSIKAAVEVVAEWGMEPAAEARVRSVSKAGSHGSGLKLVGTSQDCEEGEDANTEEQESSKHDRPPLGRAGSGPPGPDRPRSISLTWNDWAELWGRAAVARCPPRARADVGRPTSIRHSIALASNRAPRRLHASRFSNLSTLLQRAADLAQAVK
jgi:hypothetical protein